MFRNQYDNDITTWSPQGRLHQLEYAMEAVKQGAAAVGLRSSTHAVLLSVKKKLLKIDDHIGLAMTGLSSDARVLSAFMRNEAIRSRLLFKRPIPVQRLVTAIADKAQINTQRYVGRPYGVGLLVIGQDETGPHLYEFSPSGNFYDYYAVSIGARSQSAKTYLEKYYEQFENASLDDLVLHGLRALRDTLQQDKEVTLQNLSIGIVGKDHPFMIYENEAVEKYLDALKAEGGLSRTRKQSDVEMADAPAEAAPAGEEAPAQSPSDENRMDTE